MKTTSTEPMDASKQFCPNEACSARGQIGEGNIRIHSYQPQRYRCRKCKKTFSARRGTMMEGLRTPTELIVIVIILLSYGCPIQAIVHAYGVDERTVAEWQRRAGEYCQQVHQAVVEVTRKMTLGALEQAQQLLQARRGGTELKTSFIERFNGTVRERLACLTRKCQHAAHRLQTIEAGMYLIGCTYNFCVPHHELSTSKH